jgi:YbbR domain-containing protein
MKFLKRLIFENFLFKLLSVIVAFLLWLNVVTREKARLEVYSYVDIINIPKKIEIEAVQPERVSITIEGSKILLDNLKISDIHVYVDGSRLRDGENVLPVHVSIHQLKGLKILSIKPNTVVVYAKKSEK